MPKIKVEYAAGEDTQTELAPTHSRERDETQKGLDKDIADLRDEWVKKGKPVAREMNGKVHYAGPSKRYVVVKKERAAFKQMIRRACTLNSVAPVWFKDHVRTDGRVNVKLTVTDLPVKAE